MSTQQHVKFSTDDVPESVGTSVVMSAAPASEKARCEDPEEPQETEVAGEQPDKGGDEEEEPTGRRQVYPLYNFGANPDSPVLEIAMTSDLGFAVTYDSPEEQRAKWRAEKEKERAEKVKAEQAKAARE